MGKRTRLPVAFTWKPKPRANKFAHATLRDQTIAPHKVAGINQRGYNRPIAMDSIGIDIGGTSVKAAMLRDGQVLRTSKSDAFTRPDTDQLVQAIRQATAGRATPANAV